MPQNRLNFKPILSVVVPWMGDNLLFEETLASVLRYAPSSCEIIVPHGEKFVDRFELSGEVRFCLVPGNAGEPVDRDSEASGPSLNSLFNHALQVASGDYIHLLRPGIQVVEDWTDVPLQMLQNSSGTAMVSMPIQDARNHRTPSVFGVGLSPGTLRQLVLGRACEFAEHPALDPQAISMLIGPSSWCAFYSRSALSNISTPQGWIGDALFGNAAFDLDIALALKSLGYGHEVTSQHSAYTEQGVRDWDGHVDEFDKRRLRTRYFASLPSVNLLQRGLHLLRSCFQRASFLPSTKPSPDRRQVRRLLHSDRQFAKTISSQSIQRKRDTREQSESCLRAA